MDRTFLCDLCAFARALFLAGYFFSTSRQDHKDLLTRGTFASSAPLPEISSRGIFFSRQAVKIAKTYIPCAAFASFATLREDKLQIINDPTYVTILQPSAVKIYE